MSYGQSYTTAALETGVREYRLQDEMSDAEADVLAGTFIDGDNYDVLIDHDADVYKPNGDILLRFRKKAVPNWVCKQAFPALKIIHNTPTNRGMAAGKASLDEAAGQALTGGYTVKPDGTQSSTWLSAAELHKRGKYVDGRPMKLDGTLSNTSRMYDRTVGDQSSGIIGYMDRYARFPYCRQTAFTKDHMEEMAAAVPYIQAIDKVFCSHLPERYDAQMEMINLTESDWVIPDTAFTTVTVNKNFRTAVHKDAGDLKEGFGVLSVMEAGTYLGAYLVFPKYRVAVDMRNRDVLMCDVHEWHGNTPITGKKGSYIRISVVCYYRAKMSRCGTMEQELARVQARRRGDPLWDPDAVPLQSVVTKDGEEEDTDALYDEQEFANSGAVGAGGRVEDGEE